MPQASRTDSGFFSRIRAHWKAWTVLLVCVLVAAFVLDYEVQKNFAAVEPGKLYRSGQPRERQLESWIKQYNLKGILSLRHSMPAYEKELADRYGVKVHRITFSAKRGLTDQQWESARKILTDESNQPLLVHCRSGVDRTGLLSAFYRIEEQGWPLQKAFREMILQYHIPFQYPVIQQQLRERFQEKQQHREAPDLLTESP